MNHVDLFNEIAMLELNRRYNVNRGGCARFAKMMKEKHTPDLRIVYLDWDAEGISNGRVKACSHAVLTDDDYYYDANGVHLKQDMIDKYGECVIVDIDYVKKSLKNPWDWNDDFNTRHMGTITRQVSKVVKQLRAYKAAAQK